MPAFAHDQNRPPHLASFDVRRPNPAGTHESHEVHPVLSKARPVGNQPVDRLRSGSDDFQAASEGPAPAHSGHSLGRITIHSSAPLNSQTANSTADRGKHKRVAGPQQAAPADVAARSVAAEAQEFRGESDEVASRLALASFDRKDEGKPQPPPKTKDDPPKTAAKPCLPTFKSLKVDITGSVGVREVNGRCELMLGAPGTANGATFTAKVDVPAGCTGTLQYVQLVDECRTLHLKSGKDIRRKTDGYWIDKQDPIDQQQVSSSGAVEFKSDDSPGQPVAGIADRVQAIDSFKTWLMWKPDQPADAGRVPLAMATWSWSGEAKAKGADQDDCDKGWAVTQQKTSGGTGTATKDSPAATKTVTPRDPPIEEGKKC